MLGVESVIGGSRRSNGWIRFLSWNCNRELEDATSTRESELVASGFGSRVCQGSGSQRTF